MTNEDPPTDDGDESAEVGGFEFGMADGSGGPARTGGAGSTASKFDFKGWLRDTLADVSEGSPPETDEEASDTPEATVVPADFVGFEFGTWLQKTQARTPTESEPTAAATDAAVEADVADAAEPAAATAAAYGGFEFTQWMTDEEPGPKEPPETPRVVGAAPESDVSARSPSQSPNSKPPG